VEQASLRDEALEKLQHDTFKYFLNQTNPANGLVTDNTRRDSPCSIAAVGLALTTYPVGVERKFIRRDEAVKRVLATLRFFRNSPQSTEPDATGYKGFYYHFLDMQTGRRVWKSELSTIDTTYLLAGALTCALYFDRETKEEREIRALGEELFLRADWRWALNKGLTVAHAWKPERGFLTDERSPAARATWSRTSTRRPRWRASCPARSSRALASSTRFCESTCGSAPDGLC
jgi:hypothetical protein